ncbi:MAG: hypothetical protein HJJLKODD_00960 [Phycisphaerae bacterium]|nr:hypothetical protein [Phycisphaerae bacterium]
MSPLRKLLDRWVGGPDEGSAVGLLRAFGKLPSSSEFVQVECGSGAAKVFAEWIRVGYEGWVRLRGSDKSGEIRVSRLFMRLSGFRDRAVLAVVSPSRDSASPPRFFPFALYVLVPWGEERNWIEALVKWNRVWEELEKLLAALVGGSMKVGELRGMELAMQEPAELEPADELEKILRGEAFGEWWSALARSHGGVDEQAGAALLLGLESAGRQDQGLTVRLPLARQRAIWPQALAWLSWIGQQSFSTQPPTLIRLPVNGGTIDPTLTLSLRPVVSDDFLIVTSGVDDYSRVEDWQTLVRQGGDTIGVRWQAFCRAAHSSLWDFVHFTSEK